MTSDRREFVQKMALGAAALTGIGAFPEPLAAAMELSPQSSSAEEWDTSWTKRLTAKHRAVFDVAEIEGAHGIWRSQFWVAQMQEVFKAKPADLNAVVVLRRTGVSLAMNQEYWEKYGVGKVRNATHPVTMQATERNPALLSSTRGEIDANFDNYALDRAIARGTIVLACNLALDADPVGVITRADGVSRDEARARVRSYLLPGIIVQPSGIFAAMVAQEAGCKYMRVG